ncbi:uncharacterized protein [Nicotiana tomentosiformis]|uniref:uncharacterized protein n=1 Tax=Nicotiana tomentosiformis TaxID=4098 RepID=UPI00388C75D2
MDSLAFISAEEKPLALDIRSLANRLVRLDISEPSRVLTCVVAHSSLLEQIKARHFDDPHLAVLRETVLQGVAKKVSIGDDGVLRLRGRLCVPNVDGLRERILEEVHNSQYSIHPGAQKMYQDLRQHYWWQPIKKYIFEYVPRCLNFQQVKYEHQRPGGLLQQMTIPEWKLECIAMDFVVGLPRTLWKFVVVWVIIDRLTKSAHFVPVATTYTSNRLEGYLESLIDEGYYKIREEGQDEPQVYRPIRGVEDVGVDTPSIDFVPLLRDFPNVFPADLPGMPPDRDIDFGIDLVPCTQPIYIPPYRMAPVELKQLKE